jgi:hypothetical protein
VVERSPSRRRPPGARPGHLVGNVDARLTKLEANVVVCRVRGPVPQQVLGYHLDGVDALVDLFENRCRCRHAPGRESLALARPTTLDRGGRRTFGDADRGPTDSRGCWPLAESADGGTPVIDVASVLTLDEAVSALAVVGADRRHGRSPSPSPADDTVEAIAWVP